jgi:hypothetical protein
LDRKVSLLFPNVRQKTYRRETGTNPLHGIVLIRDEGVEVAVGYK